MLGSRIKLFPRYADQLRMERDSDFEARPSKYFQDLDRWVKTGEGEPPTIPDYPGEPPAGVRVIDPIFGSLWDATFNEIQNGTPVWEVYLDTPNFFAGETPSVRASGAEVVLRRLRNEGWVTFVRRSWDAPRYAPGVALSDEELDELLACARAWYEELTEDTPFPDRLRVFLQPTQRWLEWAKTAGVR